MDHTHSRKFDTYSKLTEYPCNILNIVQFWGEYLCISFRIIIHSFHSYPGTLGPEGARKCQYKSMVTRIVLLEKCLCVLASFYYK